MGTNPDDMRRLALRLRVEAKNADRDIREELLRLASEYEGLAAEIEADRKSVQH